MVLSHTKGEIGIYHIMKDDGTFFCGISIDPSMREGTPGTDQKTIEISGLQDQIPYSDGMGRSWLDYTCSDCMIALANHASF